MSATEETFSIDDAKQEILKAMSRGLNVTANAGHIRDLAEAYCLLNAGELGSGRPRKGPATPLVQTH